MVLQNTITTGWQMSKLLFLLLMGMALLGVPKGSAREELLQSHGRYLITLRHLVAQGHFELALQGHIKLQMLAQHSNTFKVAGWSYGIHDWGQLAQLYPPALKALLTLRQSLFEEIARSPDVLSFCHQLVSVNNALRRQGETPLFFQELDSSAPQKARLCFPAFQHSLLQIKDYSLLKKYQYAPVINFNHLLFSRNITLQFVDPSYPTNSVIIQTIQRNFNRRTTAIIQAAYAMGDYTSAQIIERRVGGLNTDV